MTLRAVWRGPAPVRSGTAGLPSAARALGADHPVARAARARGILAGQLTVTSAVLAALLAYALEHGAGAVTLLCAALVVELWAICGLAFASGRLRERARDVIADVDQPPAAAEVAVELAHLASSRRRQQLARSLERALYAAEHWPELSITSRPPPTVRHLRPCSETAREVARLVRDPRTSVRGVAVLDRLVCGGYSSALYAGCPDRLARELGRIRFLLETG
ncbi:MAG: hypothetical protein M3Q31_20010 [Actinomycetota bacterium]|nr:hypothetical protein [Actinomycetota bacterium]